MKRLSALLVLLIAAGGLAYWWFSPAEILKRRLGNLLGSAEVSSTMSDIGRGARGPRIADYFADPVRFFPPSSLPYDLGGSLGRERLSSLYSLVAKNCREISFTDLEILEVAVEDETAEIRFRVDALVDLGSRRPADGILEVRSAWIKREGDWQIEELRWTESGR